MRIIAVTGHVNVSDDVAEWISATLLRRLPEVAGLPLHAITCLARGADQLFAAVVLRLSGTFEVVLPARDYEQRMVAEGHGEPFRTLLSQATDVRTMPFTRSSRAAYLAASQDMLSRCDLLLACWDGRPTRRAGDTADVVAKAREQAIPIEVLWPDPAEQALRSAGSARITSPVPPVHTG